MKDTALSEEADEPRLQAGSKEEAERPKFVSAPHGWKLLRNAGILIAKNTYYAGLGSGAIPSIRVGKKFFVREDIVSLMESGKAQAGNDRQ